MGNLSFSITLLFLAMTLLALLFEVNVTAHLLGDGGAGGGGGHHHHLGGGIVGAIGGNGGLCQDAQYKALCNAILKPGVHGAASATSAAISAAILHTTQAKSIAVKMIPVTVNIMKKSSLQACIEVYDDAISDLVSAMQNVKARALPELKSNLASAMSDYDTCDEGFQELPGGICPMDNELLRHFVSNSLALAEMMHH